MSQPAGPATRAVAVALLVAAALVGLLRLPDQLSAQSELAAAGRAVPRVDGIPVQQALGARATTFLSFVRRTVPEGEPVRIVQPVTPFPPLEERRTGQPGVCGYSASRLTYFWLLYALGPHPATCDPDARWTVYARTPAPVPLPAGATAYRFPGGYTLVRR